MLPLHHIHSRKFGKKHHHGRGSTKWIDYLVILISILGPIFTLPQLIIVWGNRNAEGVSIVTWGSYMSFSLIWFTYGYIHREKPIMISNALWALTNGLVFLGAIVYGGNAF